MNSENTNDKDKVILQRILYLMKKNKMNQVTLAHKLGFKTGNAIMYWKYGKSKSYLKHIQEIAKIFNVSSDYLLGIDLDDTIGHDNSAVLNECFEEEIDEKKIKLYENILQKQLIDNAIDEFLVKIKKDPTTIDKDKKKIIKKYLIKQLKIFFDIYSDDDNTDNK